LEGLFTPQYHAYIISKHNSACEIADGDNEFTIKLQHEASLVRITWASGSMLKIITNMEAKQARCILFFSKDIVHEAMKSYPLLSLTFQSLEGKYVIEGAVNITD
jgi:hypothetical protein